MKENLEIRKIEDSINIDERLVKGTAVVFNHRSRDLGGFYEIILPTAITKELLDNSDIKVYLDHFKERGILARSKKGAGSLKYTIDNSGIHYEFIAPKTELGNEIVEGLNRGDYNESSFAFVVSRDRWQKDSDGTMTRYIEEIKSVKDFSIVADGAYSDTDVAIAKRSLDKVVSDELLKEKELTEYYNNLRNL